MNIIYRNHNWFLFTQNDTHFIQAKEPTASKLRSLVGHDDANLLGIIQKVNHSGLYKCQGIKSNWMDLWNEVSKGDKEWLLYEYINFCQRCDYIPSVDHIWFTSERILHTDWDLVKQTQSEHVKLRELKKQLKKLQTSKEFPFESAPWSIYAFLSDIESYTSKDWIQIMEHPWFIRQSHRNKDASLFALPPPMDTRSEPPSSRKHSLDDFSLNQMQAPNTFPVIRGSIMHSPTIQTFENHLSSKRPEKKPSLVHRMIRISSSLLQ